MSICRDHCPSRAHAPWLLDLLLCLALVVGGYAAVLHVAPLVGAAAMSALKVAGWVAAGAGVAAAVRAVVVAVLNRRALARYAALERQAWAARREPRALTEAARALEAAPTVRAETFVEREPAQVLERRAS